MHQEIVLAKQNKRGPGDGSYFSPKSSIFPSLPFFSFFPLSFPSFFSSNAPFLPVCTHSFPAATNWTRSTRSTTFLARHPPRCSPRSAGWRKEEIGWKMKGENKNGKVQRGIKEKEKGILFFSSCWFGFPLSYLALFLSFFSFPLFVSLSLLHPVSSHFTQQCAYEVLVSRQARQRNRAAAAPRVRGLPWPSHGHATVWSGPAVR